MLRSELFASKKVKKEREKSWKLEMDGNFLKKFNELIEDVKEVKELGRKTNTSIEGVLEEMRKLKEENENMKSIIGEIKEENRRLKMHINELDQYGKKSNIIVYGVPYQENENLRNEIIRIAASMETELNDGDISAVHRLPSKNTKKPPPIIVKMNNLDKKTNLVNNSRRMKLRGVGSNPKLSFSVAIYDHLSTNTMELLNEAKEMRKNGKIAYAWQRNGKVFIRTTEESRAVRVYDINQLRQEYEKQRDEEEERGETGDKNRPATPPRMKTRNMSQSTMHQYTRASTTRRK